MDLDVLKFMKFGGFSVARARVAREGVENVVALYNLHTKHAL